MTERMTPEALVAMVSERRDTLEALVRAVPDGQMTAPGVNGDWGVREVLAHITGWEALLMAWLAATARGETPERFAPGYPAGAESIDRLNAGFAAGSAATPPAGARAAFAASRAALLAALAPLSEADLNEPGRIPWTGDRPLLPYIASNTYEHYDEHIPMLERWIAER